MLLVIEIALFISAWRKGWRWRALIPVAAVGGLIFLVLGSAGPNAKFEDVAPMAVVLDFVLIACLGVLAAKAPAARDEQMTSLTAPPAPTDTTTPQAVS